MPERLSYDRKVVVAAALAALPGTGLALLLLWLGPLGRPAAAGRWRGLLLVVWIGLTAAAPRARGAPPPDPPTC